MVTPVKKEKSEREPFKLNLPISSISVALRQALRHYSCQLFVKIDDTELNQTARRIVDKILNGHQRSHPNYVPQFKKFVPKYLKTNCSDASDMTVEAALIYFYKRIISTHICNIKKDWFEYEPSIPPNKHIASLAKLYPGFWNVFVTQTRTKLCLELKQICLDEHGTASYLKMLPPKTSKRHFR